MHGSDGGVAGSRPREEEVLAGPTTDAVAKMGTVAAAAPPDCRAATLGVPELIRSFVASNPGTVAAYVALVLASTAVGLAGVAKFAALLSLHVSLAQQDGAFKALAALACLFVLQRLIAFGADRLKTMMAADFRRDTTTRLVTTVLEANRAAVLAVEPARYMLYVDSTARAAESMFEACVGTFLPNLVMLTGAAGFMLFVDFRCGLVFVAGLCAVAAVLYLNKDRVHRLADTVERAARHDEQCTDDALERVSTASAGGALHLGVGVGARKLAEARKKLGFAAGLVNLAASGVVIACALLLMFIAVSSVGRRDVEITALLTLIWLVGASGTWLSALAFTGVDVVADLGRCAAHALAHGAHASAHSAHASAHSVRASSEPPDPTKQ